MVDPSRAGWTRHRAGEDGAGGSARGRRRLSLIGAAGLVVVIGTLLVTAVLDSGHRTGRPAPRPARKGTASAGTAPAGASQAGTGLLSTAPAGVSWQLVDGVALPFSRADGPAQVTGGIPNGFSRTPTGALLAGVQIGFRIGSVNPADQAAVVRAMVIGTGQADLLASRPANVPAVKPQLVGFHYLTYTPTSAVIAFAWRITDVAGGTSRFISVGELQVAWSGGDWRLVDDGTQAPLPQLLDPGLTGYVRFAGA